MNPPHDARSPSVLCWAIAVALISASMASAGVPVVYHSENDDGVPPVAPVEILPDTPTTLHLYIDGGSVPSPSGICSSGMGDEICGYDLSFAAASGATFLSFTPAVGVDYHLTGTTLGVVGGDPWRGALGPRKIGDLEISGPTGATFDLMTSKAVDAALGIIVLSPEVVVYVPEPGFLTALIPCLVLLCLLQAYRQRRRVPGSALLLAAGVLSLAAAPHAQAQGQATPVCGDVVPDDTLDIQDLQALTGFLAGDPAAPDLQGDPDLLASCDVAPNGQCDVQDYVRIRRYMLEQSGGLDETCTEALPSSVVLPAPTVDQPSTISTIRASVALSGTAVFPDVEVRVTGGVGRPSVAPDATGAWKLEVPLRLGQSNALSVFQDFGDGYASAAVSLTASQTAPTGPATLEGSVLDARTGAPLLQTVDLTVGGATYQTDAFGRFAITDLPEGLMTVVAEPAGYTTGLAHGFTGAIVRSELKADANHIEVPVEVTPVAAPVTIGSAGGTVTTPSGIELVVPSGSLGSDTDLSLTELRGVAAPGYGGLPLVALPAGPIAFDPPATLRIPADAGSAGATGNFLIVEDDGVTVSPLAAAAVASGFIELSIDAADGQAILYDYASNLLPGEFEIGGVEVLKEPLLLIGSCEQDEEKPFILQPRNFFFSPDDSYLLPTVFLGDIIENPELIKSDAPTQGVGFGTITVPKGTFAEYQVTVTNVTNFETVYQYALSRPGLPTPVGSLLYDVPIAAVPVLVDSGPLKECEPKSSSAWGDPHLVRFDHVGQSLTTVHGGGRYDFQASGEFVLFESTEDTMVVQTRFVPFPATPNVTITTAAAMDVVGDRVMVDIDGGALRVRVDGVVNALTTGVPLSLPGGGELERFAPVNTQDALIVRWPGGTTVLISLSAFLGSEYLNVYPELAAARFGKVQGLLGNANGILSDDFAMRDGMPAFPVDLYTNYTTSWRISQAESLFDYELGENTSTWDGTPPLPDYGLDDLDPADRAAAEATCVAAGIDEDPLLSECALDVALLGGAATGGALDTLDQVPDVGTYVAVSGQANIFQAGQSSPVDFAGGGGPGLLPTELPLPAGTNRSMRVLDSAGNVAFSSTGSGLPPDGTGFGQVEWGSWGGVAGPRLRRMGQAMGVFLADGLPSPVPASFDCGAFDGEFAAPAIGQVFCIGDGLSYANQPQTFLVPDAATRLFVGHAERLSSQVVEFAVHHLGDNYGTSGLFALAPNPEGANFFSDPFDLPTSFTPSSGRVRVDLAETNIGSNSVWVNGQFISYLPVTGASGTTWLEDVAFTIDPSILTPTGNWIQLRSNGVNLDDFLFKNLRFEVAPPTTLLPEPSDPTPYHLGCNCGQFIGDGVGSGNWGLFALMPTPYGTSWTSPPFDVASPETLGGASVVIDIAQTDRGNNLVLVNGTVVGRLPIRPDGTVWSTDEEVQFDPALLQETGNTIEVRSGWLAAGLSEVDDFMMRNARLAVASKVAVPPGGYVDNAGVHEFIIDVSP